MVIIGVWFLIALVFGLFIVSFINNPLSGPQEHPLQLTDKYKPGASEVRKEDRAAAVDTVAMIPPRESVTAR